MKPLKTPVIVLLVLVAASVLTAAAFYRPARKASAATAQRYQVRGEIRGVDGGQVRIKHEEIPGYMAAMTMPFDVKEPGLLRGLRFGDEVEFELVVTETDSWISRIGKLNRVAPQRAPAASAAAVAEPPRVQVGEAVPDFGLIDQHGRPFRLTDYKGKAVLLTFIYTRCPLPNYCPLMSRNFAELQDRLTKEFPGRFQLVSVSIDPQFDRPEVLAEYAARFTKSDAAWTFGTGTPAQTDAVGALFGLIQERAGGLINHDLRTALIGPEGRLVHVWKSNFWTPYEVQRRVGEALGQASS